MDSMESTLASLLDMGGAEEPWPLQRMPSFSSMLTRNQSLLSDSFFERLNSGNTDGSPSLTFNPGTDNISDINSSNSIDTGQKH